MTIDIAAITDYMNYNLGTVAGIVLTIGDFQRQANPFTTAASELSELRRARELLDREISRRARDIEASQPFPEAVAVDIPRRASRPDLGAIVDQLTVRPSSGTLRFTTREEQDALIADDIANNFGERQAAELPRRNPRPFPEAAVEAAQIERTGAWLAPQPDIPTLVSKVQEARANPGQWVPTDPPAALPYVPEPVGTAGIQTIPYEPEPPHVVQLSCGHKVLITYPHGDSNGNAIRCANHKYNDDGKPELRTVVGFLPVQTITDALEWKPDAESLDTGAHHLDDGK